MDIETALKTTNTRLTFGNHRWLVWDDFMKWDVYERKPYYAKTTTLLISTFYIEDAINVRILWNPEDAITSRSITPTTVIPKAETISVTPEVAPTPERVEIEPASVKTESPIKPANVFEKDFIERSGQPEFYTPGAKIRAKTFTQLISTQYDPGQKGNVRNVHIGKVGDKEAWADGFMLEIKPVPEKWKSIKGYRELSTTTEGKPRDFSTLVPDYSTEGVEVAPILKTPLEAIKGNATFLASKDKNQAIAMDSKYVDYFMANYPDANFITKKLSISSPIIVQSRGNTVGVIMPIFKEASEYDTFLRYLRGDVPPVTP